jgi:2-polyprenyl-3-methyl-5-hydroxy-6-metoxy-1,4-benzoquinol methylase
MNEAMLDAASVARNLETLRADGFRVTETALAHEVADAPSERKAARGGAPDPSSLALMIESLCRVIGEPRDAASWERFHRLVPEAEHAWVGEADPTVLALLDAHARGGSLWEVGTGHGAIAIAASERGFRVVATDVSETALARASARSEASIVWVHDDVLKSAIRGSFDVIVDRGTLHTLVPSQRAIYAREITARTRPGSLVLVTVHTPPGDERVRTYPMSAAEIRALFGAAFEPVAETVGTFAGTLRPAPACVTVVLRRLHS